MADRKIFPSENEIPTHWYNVVADMPNPSNPALGPDGSPVTPDALAAIDEAQRCKETGGARTLFFNLSGHGHFDMASFDKYCSGELVDYAYPEAEIQRALQQLPKVG